MSSIRRRKEALRQPQGRNARPPFPAQLRPPGDPALIARGNGLYGVHCRVCHGADLRGGDQGGPNLLRSDTVLNDQAGELIAPVIVNGQQAMPPIRVTPEDARAIAEYIHSVTATMRGQGNPPLGPPPVLNVVVGDAAAGETYFKAQCGTCHSATGDLQGNRFATFAIPPRCRITGSRPAAGSRAVAAADGAGQCR